jgi:hypothetical protein
MVLAGASDSQGPSPSDPEPPAGGDAAPESLATLDASPSSEPPPRAPAAALAPLIGEQSTAAADVCRSFVEPCARQTDRCPDLNHYPESTRPLDPCVRQTDKCPDLNQHPESSVHCARAGIE